MTNQEKEIARLKAKVEALNARPNPLDGYKSAHRAIREVLGIADKGEMGLPGDVSTLDAVEALKSRAEKAEAELATTKRERDSAAGMCDAAKAENIKEWEQAQLWKARAEQHESAQCDAIDERDAARAECTEQARLNGMGSEREARLMAELATEKKCHAEDLAVVERLTKEVESERRCHTAAVEAMEKAEAELAEAKKSAAPHVHEWALRLEDENEKLEAEIARVTEIAREGAKSQDIEREEWRAEVERLSKRHACQPPFYNSDRVLNVDACEVCAGVVERYGKMEGEKEEAGASFETMKGIAMAQRCKIAALEAALKRKDEALKIGLMFVLEEQRMRDQWAEADETLRKELWRNLHTEGERFWNALTALNEGRHPALAPGEAENRPTAAQEKKPNPVPMVLFCPSGHPHIDEGEWATRPHKTHQCQFVTNLDPHEICGDEWRPADFPTVGVPAREEGKGEEKPTCVCEICCDDCPVCRPSRAEGDNGATRLPSSEEKP